VGDWMTIRVVLAAQSDEPLDSPPGRVLLAHVDHSFADLAEAIDTAFGRWDLTPLHEFDVDGRVLRPDGEAGEDEDSDELTLREAGLAEGDRFTYVFDLGEGWEHTCRVEEAGLDPFDDDEGDDDDGEEPESPVPVFGWGSIPDQYGRETEEDGDDDLDDDLDDEGEDGEDEDVEQVEGEDDQDDDDEEDEEDDDADESAACWPIVADALADVPAPLDRDALVAATAALRRAGDDVGTEPGAEVLWAAAELDPEAAPSDDEELWLELAAGVVEPADDVPLDRATAGAWTALEPADFAGAVIELVRSGEGTTASPEALIELIERCPEIDSEELDEEDEAVILAGLEVVVALWRSLGALDREGMLTPLGVWGLPRSLERAWTAG
jgi:hypothetical protein